MNHEEKMISMLEEINQRLVSVEVAQENILIPQIQALAEGQKTILDTLAPKSKVEALEEEVELLKSIIKMHTNQINDLKKAQSNAAPALQTPERIDPNHPATTTKREVTGTV